MKLILALSINVVFLVLMFLFVSHLYLGVLVASSLLVWFFYFLWHRQNRVKARIEEKIAGQEIVIPTEQVRFRALESSGYSQTDGMGYIALTESFLYFELTLFDMEISIPIDKIRGVEFVTRLKRVSPGRKMLRILFVNEKNKDDSIAVNVKDMDFWRSEITRVRASTSE